MRLNTIADISQGIPLNRIRIKKGVDVKKEYVYSFEGDSQITIPVDTENADQHIPFTKPDMILINLTSYKAEKIEVEDVGKIIPSNYIIIEVEDRQLVDPDYLQWHIDKSQRFARELHKIKQGSTILSIPINEFRRLRLKLPDIEFQKKLGRINKLQKRREKLYEERKKLIERLMLALDEEEY